MFAELDMGRSAATAKRRRSEQRWRALAAFLLALVGHAVLTGVLVFLSFVQLNLPPLPKRHAPPRAVSLRPISAEQWERNRSGAESRVKPDDAVASREKKREEKEKKKPETAPKGQVVDVAPGNNEEAPDAKYLAERSNKAPKETRAKEQTAFYRNAMPQRTSTVPQQGSGFDAVDKAQEAGNNGLADDDRPVREASEKKGAFEIPDVRPRQEVALKTPLDDAPGGSAVANRSETQGIAGNADRLRIQQGSSAGSDEASPGRRGQPGTAQLLPSMAVLDKLSGAAPNDHLKDVEEGDGTFLNTKEWKYSSFFNRVKQSVGMNWDPASRLRQRDPTGTIYGGRDRYTVLSVTLNEKGMVKDVFVEKSCGLDFLDLEAIRSFERAQPFPNPPPGLIASDSTVRFSFGFFLEMGGGPRLRMFRQAN